MSESVYTAILLASTALDDVGSHMLRIAWANDKAMALLTKISLPAELRVSGPPLSLAGNLLVILRLPSRVSLRCSAVSRGISYLGAHVRCKSRAFFGRPVWPRPPPPRPRL